MNRVTHNNTMGQRMRMLVLILSHIYIQSNLVNSGREHLFRIISSSNNMKIDIKYIYPPKLLSGIFLSNISIWRVKGMPRSDVSFTHPKIDSHLIDH